MLPDPFGYLEVSNEEHSALKAVAAGEATEHQQKLALGLIIHKFSLTHDILMVPGSPDLTGVLNGRAFVGRTILAFINKPVGE